jgi:hypothetical protein
VYKFLRVQLAPKLEGVYVELRPDDLALCMELHVGVCNLYFQKFGLDPHAVGYYNPIKLGTSWLSTVNACSRRGETVLVNERGGLVLKKSVTVLAEVSTPTLIWPTRYEDEIITISKWPEGDHYYLCSSRQRLFVPERYDTFDEAHEAAWVYVPRERIKSKL